MNVANEIYLHSRTCECLYICSAILGASFIIGCFLLSRRNRAPDPEVARLKEELEKARYQAETLRALVDDLKAK